MNRFVRLHGVCGADEGVDVPLVRRTASGPTTGTRFQREPCHSWKRMSCQTPVMSRDAEAQQ